MSLYEKDDLVHRSPSSGVYQAGAREASFHLVGSAEIDENFRNRLDSAEKLRPSQLEAVSNAMDRAVSGAAGRLESQMSVLATAVSGAPFLGLLGTVWGVMDTFSGVASSEGVASLKTMAPGVSAALVTTVVALLVAIPAMFGYNYLVNRIRSVIAQLDNYAAELRLDFERWYVDHDVESRAGARMQPAEPQAFATAPAAAAPAKPVLKKKRLEARELRSQESGSGPERESAAAIVRPPQPEGAQAGEKEQAPSHRIVKREAVLVDGEFDLNS